MNDVSIAAILPTYKTASVDKTLPLLKVAESQRVFHHKNRCQITPLNTIHLLQKKMLREVIWHLFFLDLS